MNLYLREKPGLLAPPATEDFSYICTEMISLALTVINLSCTLSQL